MNRSVVATQSPASTPLASLTTDQLKQKLSGLLQLTADTLKELAEVWRELESRGEDLSGLRSGLMQYVRLIAKSQLLPDAVVRFAGSTQLLDKMAQLPLKAQREILSCPEASVLTPNGVVVRPLHLLSVRELDLALCRSGTRSIGAQKRFLRQRSSSHSSKPLRPSYTVGIPLNGEEVARLVAHARASGISVGQAVRQCLESAGLLGSEHIHCATFGNGTTPSLSARHPPPEASDSPPPASLSS